ncbi:hypothetical protein RUM44_003738 [Polyplax serrata]|uniref:C2H2-type domain-containing protein n=1 Tax=Polyplax serrata TaxID=468196 RepID=A0ABR1AHB0_POLSC
MGDPLEKSQKNWMKNHWINQKQSNVPESLWNRVSEIINYYNSDMTGVKEEVQVPVGTDCTLSPIVSHDAQTESAIKKLVCSPDLPVFEETPSSSSPDTTFQCSFCNKTFPQKNTYQNHLRSHSKDGEDPYQCNICAKTFAVPARLTRHYRTHTGEKPYQCEYCNKSFSVKENLSVHRRIHTKERPYKCDICDRAFEHSGKLHRHMRIHTGERPHKCTICSKTFIQSGQLVIHMRTHTGEKPYVCKVCGKGFTCSKQLKVHTRTHTGEKPYNCEICGKSFGYNHVLKLHQVAHYGEKVYKCTICNETFTSKKTMELHIKSHSEQSNAQRVQSTDPGETSSCASSTSDKENKESDSEVAKLENFDTEKQQLQQQLQQQQQQQQHQPQQSPSQPLEILLSPPAATPRMTTEPSKPQNLRQLRYYLYYPKNNYKPPPPQQGVNPALLAVAAAAAASEEGVSSAKLQNEEEMSSSRFASEVSYSGVPQYSTNASPNPIEPSIYLCPDPLANMQRRSFPYPVQLSTDYLPDQIDMSDQTEDRQSLSPVLTPPSSNPVSPAPSLSPDPNDGASGKEILILPPRKRSKMILKSMEYATESTTQRLRQNSVIQFARASSLQQNT